MNPNFSEKIKAKLAELKAKAEKKEKKDSVLWKPTETPDGQNKHVVRILPNKFADDPDLPFVKLSFYHKFGKAYQIAPVSNNNPDPVFEFYDEIRRDNWDLAKTLRPNDRYFVPVLVRGHEAEGVKFWGFPEKTYQKLLDIMGDADYGDVTDLEQGHDLTLQYRKATKKGEYDSTDVVPRPKKTRYTDNPEVEKLVENMVDLKTEFSEPTYEELRSALEKYLDKLEGSSSETEEQPATDEQDFDPKKLNPTEGPKPEAPKRTQEMDDVDAEFEKIINGGK